MKMWMFVILSDDLISMNVSETVGGTVGVTDQE